MIKVENLYFSYTGEEPYALCDLSLEVRGGEYISIVGDNGSGKSTLVKILLGLLKPTAGFVEVRAKRVGYVPQRSEASYSGFPITVWEMFDSYRRIIGVRDRGVVEESLRLSGLEGCAGRLVWTLSGGQSQKALIARAVMGSPDLLVLDEPSTGVDPASQGEIYAMIRALSRERGMTIVSVEHNLAAAVANSTLIYHMASGRGHVCTPEQFKSEYMGAGGGGEA